MPLDHRPTVAVVGGGFSGLLTALHLLEAPEGPRVRLIERRPWFGRGAAYSTTSDDHLLNVRAANMSAFPDRPTHFADWLAEQDGEGVRQAFATRRRYGDYLQAMLRQAAERTAAGRLILEADEAVALEPGTAGSKASPESPPWRLTMGMGRSFHVDAAVLAVGNLPPHPPPNLDPEALPPGAYVGDPWAMALGDLPGQGLAVLIGTGLTMADVALRLVRGRPGLKMLALSRRGLVPRRHWTAGPQPSAWAPMDPASVRGVLGELRSRSGHEDWRSVLDGLRPHVQTIWREWPLEQRQRFLRHARAWWDVHRHRLSPEVAAQLDHLTGSGALAIAGGRLQRVQPSASGLEVEWTPRGSREGRTTTADVVINCTGPNGDLARADDPLLSGLVRQGRIRADACRLGLDVDPEGRLIGADGRADPSLYAVGPVTRGAFWEITSVPDIRVQAAQCAASLQRTLASRAGSSSPLAAF